MIPKDTNGFDVVLGATLAVDLSGTGAVLMICSTSSRRHTPWKECARFVLYSMAVNVAGTYIEPADAQAVVPIFQKIIEN